MTYRIEAIPAAELERIRAEGNDEAGNENRPFTEQEGGSPLRCCLRKSQPGERIMLIAYTPPGPAGPYAERGPVFVHANACDGYTADRGYPLAMTRSAQIVRGYDHNGNMAEATVETNATDAERQLTKLAAQPHIRTVHIRNAAAGCFNFVAWPEPHNQQEKND
jgi:hypothetical protein